MFTDSSNYVFLDANNALYRMQPGDTAWTTVFTLSSGNILTASAISSAVGHIYIGNGGGQIDRSTDDGISWDSSYRSTRPNGRVRGIAVSKTGNIVASMGTFRGFTWIIRSTNAGSEWVDISNFGYFFELLVFSPDNSLVGAEEHDLRLFHSTDEGENWTLRDSSTVDVYRSLMYDSDGILYAPRGSGVYSSTDDGMTWSDLTHNLPGGGNILGLGPGGNLFLGTGSHGVWMTTQSVTSVDENSGMGHLTQYALTQNYPNPFNPGTRITYTITDGDRIQLGIYDILGQEIEILVDDFKSPGDYSVQWDATGRPSGVYYYRLIIGDHITTKRMLLIR